MNKKSKGLIFTAVAAALFTTAMIPQVQAAAANVSNVLSGDAVKAEPSDNVGEMAVLKLTEQQRKSLQDRGLPVKQTPKEAETTGLRLVSLIKSVEIDNYEDLPEYQSLDEADAIKLAQHPPRYQPEHTGEVDVIKDDDEYQKKYGDADYVLFGAWE
ncbi:hypothetical protein JNUCC42_00005 [Brevibacterium sp. JNUCC-42]|nr:hypothetical protein JNUCC42_00005 [Brevibacterium sp. JNUCC-42]